MALLLPLAGAPGVRAADTATNDLPFPLIDRFEYFRMQDGIPTHKVHCVLRASDGRITSYLHTTCGLPNNVAYGMEEAWFATSDGLAHAILSAPPKSARVADAK
jgi:hypothetical protein